SKVHQTLQINDVLTVRSGGGAGYGDVSERDPKLVEQDIREERVLPDSAEKIYGRQALRAAGAGD
ncbi:MAG: hypothetical protein WD535_04660, partial [Thermaerobacterales bacterium]